MRAQWLVIAALFGCDDITPAELPDGAPQGHDASQAPDADPSAPDADGSLRTTVFAAADIVDTYVRLEEPTFNWGVAGFMFADTSSNDRRILLRIDVSSLSAGISVVAADLHLWTGTQPFDGSTEVFSIYELLESWDEGAGTGTVGAASWNERSVGNAWTATGAGIGSRDDVPVGSFVPAAVDTEFVVPLEPDLIGRWVEDASSNNGVVIVAAGPNAGGFESSESATESKRPSLWVTWSPP